MSWVAGTAWATRLPVRITGPSDDVTLASALAWESVAAVAARAGAAGALTSAGAGASPPVALPPWTAVGDALALTTVAPGAAPVLDVRAAACPAVGGPGAEASTRFWHAVSQALAVRWGSSDRASALGLDARAAAFADATHGRASAALDWDADAAADAPVPVRVVLRRSLATQLGVALEPGGAEDPGGPDRVVVVQRPVSGGSASLSAALADHVGSRARACRCQVMGVELPPAAMGADACAVWRACRGPDGWLTIVVTDERR